MFEGLGLALRILRETSGKTAAEVARRSGLGKSQISKYERDKELPKLDSLQRYLKAIGIDQSLPLFYLLHQVRRLRDLGSEDAERALLVDGSLRPLAASEMERLGDLQAAVLRLFEAIVEERLRWGSRKSTPPSP